MTSEKSNTSWRKLIANDLNDLAEQLVRRNASKEDATKSLQALIDWIHAMHVREQADEAKQRKDPI